MTYKLGELQAIAENMLTEMDRVCRRNNLRYHLAYGTVLGAIRHKGFIPWDDDIDITVAVNDYEDFIKCLDRELPSEYQVAMPDKDRSYTALFARIVHREIPHYILAVDIFPLVGAPASPIGRLCFAPTAYLVHRAFHIKRVNPNSRYAKKPGKRVMSWFFKVVLLPIPERLLIWLEGRLSNAFPFSRAAQVYNICGNYGYREFINRKHFEGADIAQFGSHEFPVPLNTGTYLTHMYGDYMTPPPAEYQQSRMNRSITF